MASKAFFFPITHIVPGIQTEMLAERLRLLPRKWSTSTFDLATLATKHKLELSYQIVDVFLQRCNLEIRIDAENLEDAKEYFRQLQAMLYVAGLSPFIAPLISSHPIADYSGINSRDSDILKDKLHEGLRNGFKSADGQIEMWPFNPSFSCFSISGSENLDSKIWEQAVGSLLIWNQLERRHENLKNLRNALIEAAHLPGYGSSIIHLWQGIEGLFPNINQELSFRLSFYLGCLAQHNDRKDTYLLAKKSYSARSKAAHGSGDKVTRDDWLQSWMVACSCMSSIINRRRFPSEQDLIEEVLSASI